MMIVYYRDTDEVQRIFVAEINAIYMIIVFIC